MDKNQARENAINRQIRPWGGLNYVANNALQAVPREFFVPPKYKNLAFADMAIPLGDQARMLPPKVEGRILDCLNIKNHESVLEIGTGSGYLSAVLGRLAKSVLSIEIDQKLSKNAAQKLNEMKIENVVLKVADATAELSFEDFFDVVVVAAAMVEIPKHYLHLIRIGGRMFAVEGETNPQTAKCITRTGDNQWQTRTLFETEIEMMRNLVRHKKFDF